MTLYPTLQLLKLSGSSIPSRAAAAHSKGLLARSTSRQRFTNDTCWGRSEAWELVGSLAFSSSPSILCGSLLSLSLSLSFSLSFFLSYSCSYSRLWLYFSVWLCEYLHDLCASHFLSSVRSVWIMLCVNLGILYMHVHTFISFIFISLCNAFL